MSSSIYLNTSKPITLKDWQEFCDKNGIVYSPNTIGHNIFYKKQVEITFGESNHKELPKLENGMLDFSKSTPCESAAQISVSSFFMSNLDETVAVAKAITNYFCAQDWQYEAALELRRQCRLELKNCQEYHNESPYNIEGIKCDF
jgi:hypothetical protein